MPASELLPFHRQDGQPDQFMRGDQTSLRQALCRGQLLQQCGATNPVFAVVRYGNVMGSRGSVIPFFLSIAAQGRRPITDPRMTRFSLEQGVE